MNSTSSDNPSILSLNISENRKKLYPPSLIFHLSYYITYMATSDFTAKYNFISSVSYIHLWDIPSYIQFIEPFKLWYLYRSKDFHLGNLVHIRFTILVKFHQVRQYKSRINHFIEQYRPDHIYIFHINQSIPEDPCFTLSAYFISKYNSVSIVSVKIHFHIPVTICTMLFCREHGKIFL